MAENNKSGFKQCFCKTFGCAGKLVSTKTVRRHMEKDYATLKSDRLDTLRNHEYRRTVHFNEDLYTESDVAKTKLYPGSELTVLEAIFLKIRTFVGHTSSKAELSEIFRNDHQHVLPKPNNMPSSYEEAYKLIEPFLLPLETYDVCVDDCMLFRGEHSEKDQCVLCGKDRRYPNGRPKRIFKYFPLGPQIARLYGSESLKKYLEVPERPIEFVADIQDTAAWNVEWFSEDGAFRGRIGVGLSFCADGVNPLRQENRQYSMCPLLLQILNFPPSFRKSFAGIHMLGIVPGNGSKEAFNLEPYLDVFVEELQELMHCTIYLKKKNEEVKVRLCQYIFDTPAMAKVMHICGQGALRACMWCKNEGKRISDLNKVVYHGSRKFLPEDHVLRESKGYPGGKPENSEPGVAYSKEEQISLRQQWEDKPNKS
eukprot:TCONS_00034748-protein